MDNFIKTTDYDSSIHKEILDSLLRADSATYDPQIVEICENRAITEMRSYLNKSYDCDAIFSAQGDDRNALILMFAIDITIYHIFCIHNPYKISQIRKDRYNRAVEWMNGVMKGDITIDGAPTLSEEESTEKSRWQIQCDDVRPVLL